MQLLSAAKSTAKSTAQNADKIVNENKVLYVRLFYCSFYLQLIHLISVSKLTVQVSLRATIKFWFIVIY